MSLYGNNRIGSGYSAGELNAADWWNRNLETLRKAGYASIVGFIALTWGFGIWTLFDAYALSYPKEQRYGARIAATTLAGDAAAVTAPEPLQLGGTQALTPEPGLEHLYAPVQNANTLWWAEIQYRFREGELQTPLRTAVLLPNETRIITELGWQGANLRTPSLSIEQTEWKRIDADMVGKDYTAYKERTMNFSITNAAYQSDLTLDDKRLGRSTFRFTNPTGYAYRNIELLILLYRSGTIAGINRLSVPDVAPGQSQDFSVVWPSNPTGIDRVDVRPFANILDPETFKIANEPGT